ncbi:WD_REPEATS_REGION domain-containing protein, partial [Haematococcus lacustris]
MAESHWPEELLQDLADLGPDGVPRLEPLWDWVCPATEGHQVACMAWNKAAPDLLAVGYGTLSFSKTAAGGASSLTPGDVAAGKEEDSTAGLVAFWSLKNPKYPLW